MKIGFFDSGIGGLSVLAEALMRLDGNEYLFLADTDHVPYGTKTKEQIRSYAMENVRFLVEQGAQAIVVACNTATAAAIDLLRETLPITVIGMEPAVKPALEFIEEQKQRNAQRKERVMVIATPLTLREEKLKTLLQRIDPAHRVDLLPLPKLVDFAEQEVFDTRAVRSYLQEAFSAYEMEQYGVLVLGCTHFLYFKSLYREIADTQLELIDGNTGTIRQLAHVTGSSYREEPEAMPSVQELRTRISFYTSARPMSQSQTARCLRLLARFSD